LRQDRIGGQDCGKTGSAGKTAVITTEELLTFTGG
jgi:hypothetical protein